MSDVWVTIIALTITTAMIRASGPVLLGGRDLHPLGVRMIALLAPALLAALIVMGRSPTRTATSSSTPARPDWRPPAVLVWRQSAMLAAVAAAAVAAALVRPRLRRWPFRPSRRCQCSGASHPCRELWPPVAQRRTAGSGTVAPASRPACTQWSNPPPHQPRSPRPRRAPRMAASTPDVSLTGISKRYGEVVAIDHVELEIAPGEFFTMLGPSGSGKTTTLRMIAGFDVPDTGRVEIAGQDVTDLPAYDREVNTVFQDYALFPHMTVAENVEYGLRVAGVAEGGAGAAGRRGARDGPPAATTAPASRRSSPAASASAWPWRGRS